MRFPLYSKIIGWFFLNLVVLAAVFFVLVIIQFRTGLDSLLMGQARDRFQAVSQVITAELNETPSTQWDGVMKRFSSAYQVHFLLIGNDGMKLAGENIALPPELTGKMAGGRQRPARTGRGPPPSRGPPSGRGPARFLESATNSEPTGWGRNRPFESQTNDLGAAFTLHTGNPSRYWVGTRLGLTDSERRGWGLPTLLAMSESLHGGGLFFDLRPWVAVGFGAVFLSMLIWLPLVRGITGAIAQMTQFTELIAEGRFDARVQINRKDELGRLAQAINRMALRLSGFVHGQKRFLGDIAHELCSPLARLQVALGILEQRAEETQKASVADVREEVQQISSLVNELLSFSKTGLQQKPAQLKPVQLAALVRRMVQREAADVKTIDIQMADSLWVLADPGLLDRALANLTRNALRYAGTAWPIVISAASRENVATLTVSDSGPGVPDETLGQIFDPFFRLEPSRSRETGGVGLGLAIVKTCVEACQGKVTAQNRQPSGLEVRIELQACNAP